MLVQMTPTMVYDTYDKLVSGESRPNKTGGSHIVGKQVHKLWQCGLGPWLIQRQRDFAGIEPSNVYGSSHGNVYPVWWMDKRFEVIYTLWLFNIAMENCPFIDGLAIKNCDFPWLC